MTSCGRELFYGHGLEIMKMLKAFSIRPSLKIESNKDD
jgi:hypothetical protein